MSYTFNPYNSISHPKSDPLSAGIQPQTNGNLEKKGVSNISLELKKSQFLHDHLRPLSNPTFLDKVERIFNKILRTIFGIKNLSRARAFDTYRTQEHLMYGLGSSEGSHNKFFLNSIKICEKLSNNFAKLSAEISNLNNNFYDFSTYERQSSINGEEEWVENTQKNLRDLLPSQSTWIYTATSKHAMMMRVEKNENQTFNLYFANTGAGILANYDFHPPKEGTNDFRLVSMIEKIPETTLLEGDFLKNFVHSLDTGKNSEAALKTTPKIDESHLPTPNPTNAIYRELRTLIEGETTLNVNNDPRHFAHPQMSGSCEASCILAMIRSELSTDEFKLLETQMQVNTLAKHYNLLKYNADRSSTRKTLALDLIETLKNNPLIKNDLPTLLAMEKDIKNSFKMSEAALKIKSSKIKIEDFLEKKDDGVFEMTSLTPLISYKKKPEKSRLDEDEKNKTTSLKAYLGITSLDNNFKYHLVKNSEDRWSGKDYSDKLALVCFYAASGDQANTEYSLEELLDQVQPKHEIGSNAYNKQLDAERNIFFLVDQLKQLDHTRSGIAKQLFFSSLIIKLICERTGLNFQDVKNDLLKIEYWNNRKIKQIQNNTITKMEWSVNDNTNFKATSNIFIKTANLFNCESNQFIHAKYFYHELNVEHNLPEKNIWMQSLAKIEMRQPKVTEPIAPQSAGFHLEEQLNEPNIDVKTAIFAKEAFH